MRALAILPLLLCVCLQADQASDRAAIHKIIARFNHPHERGSVITHDADLAPLDREEGPGVSPLFFEVTTVSFVTPDVAFVDATTSQYGSVIVKRLRRACFVLRRDNGEWRIALMR